MSKRKEVEYTQIGENLWECSGCGCHINGGLGAKIDGPHFHFVDSKCFCGGLIKRVITMKLNDKEEK